VWKEVAGSFPCNRLIFDEGEKKMALKKLSTLALDGGAKAVPKWPTRGLIDAKEKQAVVALFDQAIESGNAIGYNGAEEENYCKEFSAFMGGGYADGVNSGSSAVYVALRAMKVKAFSEVICGPISDPGGFMPIALAGCIPVPADAEPGSFNMSPKSLAQRITKHTGAIVVTHIAGLPAEMEPILDLAKAKGIPVIEDCAQAHGALYRGKRVGSLGDIGAFSTMSGKHHCTGGQGGVVFSKSEETYWQIRRCADRGKPFNLTGTHGNVLAAHNMNLNELSACIGRVQLRKLPRIVAARQKSARWLIASCREKLKSVRIVDAAHGSEGVYWFLIGQLDLTKLRVNKETFVKALSAEGLPCGTTYLHVFADHDWYRNRNVFEGTTYPWTAPLYKGDPTREYPIPNVRATDKYSFQLFWNERVTPVVARQALNAIKKVEQAYLA